MAAHPLVLIIGGTRGTGLLVARLLCERGTAVRVLARDPNRARTVLDPSIEVVRGDLTQADTLPAAVAGASHIVFTAGRRSGRPVTESRVKATEYDGVLNTLEAARQTQFAGRFLYMTSGGIGARSFWTFALNLYKGNTLVWRGRAEEAIRASGLAYTIIRCGMLVNQPGGMHAIEVTQRALPLSPRYRIGRADVAEAFVAALDHPNTRFATFEIVWKRGDRQQSWPMLLDAVKPDAPSPTRQPA